MKKFLMLAALAVVFAAPAMAEDAAPVEGAAVEAVTTTVTTTEVAPTADVAAAAKEACTAETNEKVKLPDNAGEAEQAQWDAAFAECVKGKGVETVTETTTEVKTEEAAPAVTEEAPAAE